GHSRGGGAAILNAAGDPRAAGLVTWSAISTVLRWSPAETARWRADGLLEVPNTRTGQILHVDTVFLDECESLAATTLDIRGAASRLEIPWLIIHGTQDETVPFREAEELRDASRGGSATLLPIEGANHTFDVRHPVTAPSAALV